jgi:hypothetical protein
MSNIERVNSSIIGWSKIIAVSSSGTLQCVVLEQLERQHASVVPRDELHNYLRPPRITGEVVSLLEQRQAFLQRLAALQTVIQAAS